MTNNRRPQAIVDALVAKAAEVLLIDASDVMSPSRKPIYAFARFACYQVLREASWQLNEIGAAFERDHSTIYNGLAKSQLLERVDAEHAYLVTQLRHVLHEATRPSWFAAYAERTRAQVWALDQEIAAATVLRDELVGRITVAQRLRSELAAVLADFPTDVITRQPQLARA